MASGDWRPAGDMSVRNVPGGNPPQRPDQVIGRPVSRAGYGPAPQTPFFGRLVVVAGATGGIFMYSPTAGKGNLVFSIAPHAGTDPYGNVYPAGAQFGVWSAAGVLLNHFGINTSGDIFLVNSSSKVEFHGRSSDGAFFWYNSSGEGLGNLATAIAPTSGTDAAGNSYPAGFSSNVNINVFGAVIAIQFDTLHPSSIVVETWQTASLSAGFAAGPTTPQYQLEGMNATRVRLRGQVNLTANQAQFTTMFTLASGYVPANQTFWTTPNNLSGAALGNTIVRVTSAGAVQLGVAGSNTNFVILDGIVIPLD